LVGGHDTSGTTLSWVVKYLADNQSAQAKLRRQLHTAYAAAAAERRQPTVTEITKISAPYLDAVLEESFRLSPTLPLTVREAVVDTTILGCHVPKGTSIFMFNGGPSVTQPPIPFDESRRSESSQATTGRVGTWDDSTVERFDPDRWIKPVAGAEGKGEFGSVEFDQLAGPFFAFGAGPRGCFGRRLAYLELRIVTALLAWNFEFGKCAEELSGYWWHDSMTSTPRQCYVKIRKLT
jgi:cytochrome P450